MDSNKWIISSSEGVNGAAAIFTGSASRYKLTHGSKTRNLYWGGLGVTVSIPYSSVTGGMATAKHSASAQEVYFSQHPFHKRYSSNESVFRGNGMILEFGLNTSFIEMFGLKPMADMIKKSYKLSDYENQISLQMLMFTCNSQISGLLTGTFLSEALTILTQLGLDNKFSSYNTGAVAFSASTATAVDSAGISVTSGIWFLPF